MIVGIIGAGASGMAAALSAAGNANAQVVLFERQSRVGKKLQATGNGRCNLTNLYTTVDNYHGEEPAFVCDALEQYGPERILDWFRELGLFTVAEPSGKVYPYSDHANSVVDILRLALERPNIQLCTGFEVQKISKENNGFLVHSSEQTVFCHKLIIACGGLAGTKLGGSMSGYKLLNKMGHKSTRLRPSLVQLKSDWGGIAALKGVRANCHIDILKDGEVFSQSTGEIQFTDYGLSGPVVFEVSRDVCFETGCWVAKLDLLPDYTAEALTQELRRRMTAMLPMEDFLTGILHNRLGRVLTKAAGLKCTGRTSELSQIQIDAVVKTVKAFEISLTEPMGMDNAQVTAGGICTRDFDRKTMESKLVPGLYACGEVLDIDGDCGGYNLQWAWSSGCLAGIHAGKDAL